MNILIQKKNALFNYKAFTSGFIRTGPYKGKSCEITDILSTGLYQVRVALMDSIQQTNIDPTNIIPDKHEKHKIEKALKELKSPGFLDLLKKESQVLMLSNVKNKIKNVDHLYELFYPNQKPVYIKKTIIVDNRQREILVAQPYKEHDPVINDFLQLIFDKVKIQLVIINDEINVELKNQDIKQQDLEQEYVDYVNIEMLENDIREKPQEELFDFEENLNRQFQEAEYIIPLKNNLFFRACQICALPISPDFINSHSQIINNYITFHFNQSSFYNNTHDSAIIVAYIFIYFNQIGKQILNEILESLKIKVTSNNDPESILNLMLYHSFLGKSDISLVDHYISSILKIENITLHNPGKFKRLLIRGSGADPRTYKHLSKPMILSDPQIRKTLEEPIKYDLAEKIKFRLNELNSGGTIDEIQALKDLQSHFSTNIPIKGKKYNKYTQVFLNDYNKRLSTFENEYVKMIKKKSNLLKNIKSPIKNEITKNFISNIKNGIVKEIQIKIKKDKNKLSEYSVLQYFLAKFDTNPELIYALTENPQYASLIKPYIDEYEKILNETILKNRKANLEKIIIEQNLESQKNQQKLLILKNTSDKFRKIIDKSYDEYKIENKLGYNPNTNTIKLYEKLYENLSIISDYSPEKIERIKLSLEFYNKINADITKHIKRRNYLFELLNIKQTKQGEMEVPIVLTKSSKLLKSKIKENPEIHVSSLSKVKKSRENIEFINQVKVIQDIKNEFIQLDKYINNHQKKQIEKIKNDLIFKDIKSIIDRENYLFNLINNENELYKKNKSTIDINTYKKLNSEYLQLKDYINNYKTTQIRKFKTEKEQKTQIILNELNSIANKTFNEIDYDNHVIILNEKLQDQFKSINPTLMLVTNKRKKISSPENKKLFRQIYSNEYYKNVDRLNLDIFNDINNDNKLTKNKKEYIINRLKLIFNGSLDKLKFSFDKKKSDLNNDLLKLFKSYQEELQQIKKVDKEHQKKRPKITPKGVSNLISSFQKI